MLVYNSAILEQEMELNGVFLDVIISVSNLLFCLALIPSTNMLNRQEIRFELNTNNKINHLFYRDDLNLIKDRMTSIFDWCSKPNRRR